MSAARARSGPVGAEEIWASMCAVVLDNERRRQACDALGLPFSQIRALRRIAARPMSMGEVATALATDAPHATLIVDELAREGLVRRDEDPRDRRRRIVSATARGRRVAQRAESILGTPPAGFARLTPSDLATLGRLVNLVRAVPSEDGGRSPIP